MDNIEDDYEVIDNDTYYKEDDRKEIIDLKIIREYIISKSYPFEVHNTTTEDGYILTLFRIPGPKSSINDIQNSYGKKPPILFQHGILDSADGWLCNDEARCLPFIFANNGFDVWLGNSR